MKRILVLLIAVTAFSGCSGGGSGGGSVGVAQAQMSFGAIEDCDFFIILPNGVIRHFDEDLQLVGELGTGLVPQAGCAFGLLQFEDKLVLAENCLVPGSLTQRAALVIGLDGQVLAGDFSDIDCSLNFPVVKFDFNLVPDEVFQALPIEGALSGDFFDNTGETLEYILRLDGFFDGDSDTEVTFGGELVFTTFAGGNASLVGELNVNSVNRDAVPQELIDSGAAGPFDVSIIFRPTTGPNPDFDYYEIIPIARELVNLNDPADDFASLISFPLQGNKPFQVGFGANGKNSNLGASGWLDFVHVTHDDIDGFEVFGCLREHLTASDFLMDLVPITDP